MAYRIEYKSSLSRDLKGLDKNIAKRLIKDLEETLSRDINSGEALSCQFKGVYKLRIGDYRVIYSKTKESVLILRIGNCSMKWSFTDKRRRQS